jgi:hypothetical protein
MPATYNFTLYQGQAYRQSMVWKDSLDVPVDLTGYTAKMQIRKRVTSAEPYIELNTEDGGITLGGVLGTILLEISAEDTAALTWRGNAVYDLELTPANGATKRLLQGTVTFSPEVTRPVPVAP